MKRHPLLALLAAGCLLAPPLLAQDDPRIRVVRDSISIEFVDADLRGALQSLGRYLSKPLLLTSVPSARVTFQTPAPVPRDRIAQLLRELADAYGLDITEEPGFFRVRERATAAVAPLPGAVLPAPAAATPRRTVQLRVVRLRHARAPDVAAVVNQLFGGSGAFSGSGGLSSGTLSDELRRMNTPPAGASAAAQQEGRRGAELSGPVTIVPDEITNALLVRADSQDYELVRQAVSELDIRPLQVLIEVLIVEARRDHTFSFGADLFVPEREVGQATVTATTTGGGLGDLVLRVMNIGGERINATIRAAESRGNVNIVSRPVLLASNNTEARLLVGSQRPFVQVSRSLPTDTPTRDQVVQYRDVGTRLVVKPTINHDGYVSLEIQQEVNAATTETQFDAPIISTREASTRVLMRNGQTVMLGGLRDQQQDRSNSGVPFLSGLPLIGGLFGGVSRRDASTELYLFLTPRILTTDADADSVTTRRLPPGVEPP